MAHMVQIAIRCRPSAPVATEELERWLTREVGRLRESAPGADLRLLRLTQAVPTADVEMGWLVELDAADGATPLDGLEAILRDMRLLGLRPTVLRNGNPAS
jgi:hypothetical protein